jgi:hypothetical protein
VSDTMISQLMSFVEIVGIHRKNHNGQTDRQTDRHTVRQNAEFINVTDGGKHTHL